MDGAAGAAAVRAAGADGSPGHDGPEPEATEAASGTGTDPGTGPAGRGDRLGRFPGWLVLAVPALAELIIGGYRISGPSLWRDEAATIVGAARPFGAILALVRHEDAVHAPYYLLLHPVIALAGTSELALRLPSLLATCAAVALTAALGRRLAVASALPAAGATGLLAGLALAAVPLTTRYAQEARPYALATLSAVLASYLLVRAVTGGRTGWWAGYAMALALTGLFNLFALPLLALAHGVSLALSRRREAPGARSAVEPGDRSAVEPGLAEPAGRAADSVRRWLMACAVAGILTAPIVLLSAGQSAQISWVARPGPSAVASLMRDFAGTAVLIPFALGLALVGCAAGLGIRRGAGLSLAVVAVPWLVVPPVLLIAVSLAHPVYVERYVVFCLPALALLVGAGLTGLVQLVRSSGRLSRIWPGRERLVAVAPSALAAVIMVAALTGPQLEIRRASARPDNLRAVAAALAARERPGDAIIYLPWGTRMVGMAYQAPFGRLDDVEAGLSPVASATLRGVQAPPAVVSSRLAGVSRIWTIRWAQPPRGAAFTPTDRLAAAYVARLRQIGAWKVGSVILTLYARR